VTTPTPVEAAVPSTAGGEASSSRPAGRSELGLAALLLTLGLFVLVETSRIDIPANANSIGPRFFPTLVGGLLCLIGSWLSVDVLRGGRGDMEAAEDIDLSRTSDWRTLGLLSAVFLAHAALLQVLGFAVAGTLLFFGVGAVLGSRRWARDLAIATVLATGVYVVFGRLLGVGLPAGLLEGVL